MQIRVVVERAIPADRETVFGVVPDTTANWPKFFPGFKPFVGAITAASIQGGGPVVAGARRDIAFSDGTSIVELIVDYEFGVRHHYQAVEMTKLQRATMSVMDSDWEFLDAGPDACKIHWTYTLTPRSILTWPLVRTVGAFGFRGAMRNCLGEIQRYFGEQRPGAVGAIGRDG